MTTPAELFQTAVEAAFTEREREGLIGQEITCVFKFNSKLKNAWQDKSSAPAEAQSKAASYLLSDEHRVAVFTEHIGQGAGLVMELKWSNRKIEERSNEDIMVWFPFQNWLLAGSQCETKTIPAPSTRSLL